VGDPEIAAKVSEGLEDVVSQSLALFNGRGPVHGIEDEEAGVGGSTVLEEMRSIAEVTDH
jgi:hypothetical protein